MFTDEENKELFTDASTLAYMAIRFSGLHKDLSGSEWDELADVWGAEIVSMIAAKCEAKLEALATNAEVRAA